MFVKIKHEYNMIFMQEVSFVPTRIAHSQHTGSLTKEETSTAVCIYITDTASCLLRSTNCAHLQLMLVHTYVVYFGLLIRATQIDW